MRWFPCSLLSACRRRSPALPQRHRHRYAADLPHGLPDQQVKPAQKIPAASLPGRKAPHPAHIRQIRAGDQFEGRNNAGSSRTPLRLARRTRTIWQYWHTPALSGLLPTLPGTTQVRLPSASTTCCDRPQVAVSHPHTKQQRLTAHSLSWSLSPASGHNAGLVVNGRPTDKL